MRYVATRGFEYPTSLAVRNQIRQNGPLSSWEGVETHNVSSGESVNPPEDLLESWLHRGLIKKAVTNATQK